MGEPGIGKTRLLAELAARADARGQLVLSGSASELERDLPFWVFVDALDEYAEGLDPRRLEQLDETARTELAHVFPSLSALGNGWRRRVCRTSATAPTARCATCWRRWPPSKPLVLILDDLHWADSGTIELLGALLRRLPSAPVLIAMAMRPRQTPGRLAAAFERAHRAGRLTRHELGALTLPETRQLLGPGFDDLAATALYEDSGGNPFYLEQLARSLDRAPGPAAALAEVSLEAGRVPPAVVAALTEELGLLSDGARLVLEGAAVAGDPFEPELVAAAAAVTEPAAFAALDELLRCDLVRPTDVPRRFRFRHPLVRRAVYDASPGGWRLGAHERCAEALAARGASVTARVHHVERSARHGDEAAVAVLREAGTAAAQRTPATAARWFAAALRLLGEGGPQAERVELLTALAGAQAATGQFADARAALLEALQLLPEDETATRLQLTAACAGMEQLLGRHEEAHARLVGALEGLDDPASPEAVALMITLAMDAFYRQARADSRDWGARALAVARPLGDEPLIAAAAAALALAYAFEGALGEAELYRAEAAALIDGMPDDTLAIRLDAIAYLTGAEVYMDRFDESAAHGVRGLAVARATGQGFLVPMLTQASATAISIQGRLVEAAELLDGAVEASRLAGNDQTLAWDLMNRAFVDVHRGEMDRGDRGCRREHAADARTRQRLRLDARRRDARHRAHGERRAGEGCRAVRRRRRRRGDAAAPGRLAGEVPRAPDAWLADARQARPKPARAAELRRGGRRARRASAWPRHGRSAPRPPRRSTAGDAAAAADARARLGRGVRPGRSRRRSRRVAHPRRHCARRGPVMASAPWRSSSAPSRRSTESGATRYRLEAERELRKLGHAVHRRSRPGKADENGIASLSARELELARLVVDRKTNPEIAAALFLSQKTVESHLRNIFRKLGVSSRVELARAVERADRNGESNG